MTLPSGGNNPPISLSDINAEFSLGTDMNAYRSQRWFKDDNSRGFFPAGAISFSDFYAKRKLSPVVGGSVTYNSSQTIPFPSMFNNLTVTVVSGQGGTNGQGGNCRGGGAGGVGGATNFGSYVSTGTGAAGGFGGAGSTSTNSTSWAITDANQASILALYNQSVSSTVGGGGGAGSAGADNVIKCASAFGITICTDNCEANKSSGSAGAGGYISLSWS